MRRLLLPLTALLVLALTASAPAAIQTYDWSGSFAVGPGGSKCTIVGHLWKDSSVTAANPAPAILATNGFGGSRDDFDTVGPAYAQRGYVFVGYSGLGFGGSQCKITLDDPASDGKAASDIIDILAGKGLQGVGKIDFVTLDGPGDPRVGMMGGSYGGEVQFAAASLNPHLDTIVPQITWNDLSYSLAPNDTSFDHGVTSTVPGTEKQEWVSLFFGLGVAQGTQAIAGGDTTKAGGLCVNFPDQACMGKVEMDATGYPSQATTDFARHASVASYMSKIRIPTFLAQGQTDSLFNLQEVTATYDALRAQNTPVKMLWKSNGHSGGLGSEESSDAKPESAYASRAYLEWYDYYLRGIGDPPALDFSYYRDYVPFPKGGDAAPAVATAPAFPVAPDETLYLSGTDALVPSAGAVKAGSAQFAAAPALPASISEISGPVPQQPPLFDSPGTFAAFTTAPLAADADVVGMPKVTVRLDAPTFAVTQGADNGGKLVLFAKLYDVDASGAKTLPNRLVAPVRVPDVTKPVTIQLPGIVHRFAKGHTMQLVLASSDAAYKGNDVGGPVTVKVDPAAPSALTIPVLGAAGSVPAPVPTSAASQRPGAGANPGVVASSKQQAAKLPKACVSRRSFVIRLHRVKRPDRVVSATVTVNGKRVKVVRGKRLKAPIKLAGLPKGTYRVVVTQRTKRHKTLRSARTYHTCVPSKKH